MDQDTLFSLRSSFRGEKRFNKMRSLVERWQLKPMVKVVHVAGTNGKGSCCHLLHHHLRSHGMNVGLFTSPHVQNVEERIQINGQPIAQQTLYSIANHLEKNCMHEMSMFGFFEWIFVIAMIYFKKHQLDYLILETGIGGRYDPTNTLNKVLAIITSIGMDHQNILGDTLEEIAMQKAGIIQASTPVVLGQSAALPCVIEEAITKKSSIFFASTRSCDFRAINKATVEAAVKALRVQGENLRCDVAMIQVPARYEKRHLTVSGQEYDIVCDVAHNFEGLQLLIKMLENDFPSRSMICIFNCARDKSIEKMLSLFARKKVLLVYEEALTDRYYTFNEMNNLAKAHGLTLQSSLENAINAKSPKDVVVVVTGSFKHQTRYYKDQQLV